MLWTKYYTMKGYTGCKSKIHLDTQKKLCLAHDEAFGVLYKPLPLSVWLKQLPPYTIGCKTQIAVNIFKAASLSFYIIVAKKIIELLNKQPLYLIKILRKLHNHLNKWLHCIERIKLCIGVSTLLSPPSPRLPSFLR